MALAAGTKFGPYEIVAALGAGGMGEVYRARDTRLGREVAIKVLPQHLSANPDLKVRFEREAKAISALNHPHICHLYDVGAQDGTDYLVMELLEGESLDKRLERGPLPLKQALEVGAQIAEALEKAHKSGIVHRDLKPGNIVLTKEGAKLLDFGLAKPSVAGIGAVAASSSGKLTPSTPTMSVAALASPAGGLTQQGTIVGTFQYMAPEVLQGQEADARSDLFSFGCVLYEMVTGRKAFEGKSQLSVLTAILEKDPEPLSKLQPQTPASLEHTIQTCLEKNPEERFQSAHDVRVQLAWIAKSGSSTTLATPATGKKSRRWEALAGAGVAIAVLGIIFSWMRAEPARTVTRASLLPPEGTHFATLYRSGSPALSPDGTKIAFIASRSGKVSLWVRSLDKLEATELPGTEEAYFPFWSPDGHHLGFFANGKLWRAEANGGSPIALCSAPEARGASWSRGNQIVFDGDGSSLFLVSADGGPPAPLVGKVAYSSAAITRSDRWPYFLPDGKHFLYLYSPTGSGNDRNEIHFASTDGKTNKALLTGRYYVPEYARGWLLVGRAGALVAQRFDPERGELKGEAIQITDNLQLDDNTAGSVFSVSQNGVLVYQTGGWRGTMYHMWTDTSGGQLGQASEPGVYGAVRISPDGTKFASQVYGQSAGINIAVWDLVGRTRSQFASGRYSDAPVWSPDSSTLYFGYSGNEKPAQIYTSPVDGSRPQREVIATHGEAFPNDVSGDGKWLLYQETIQETGQLSTLNAVPLAGGEPIVVVERIDGLSSAAYMPGNNGWLAYQSSDSGRPEVYLTRFPNAGAKYQVSLAGGVQPVWSKDGKRLYYLDPEHKLTVVDIKIEKNAVQAGARKTLFQTSLPSTFDEAGYDVARDGRFLVMSYVTDTPSPMTLVTNWDAELKK